MATISKIIERKKTKGIVKTNSKGGISAYRKGKMAELQLIKFFNSIWPHIEFRRTPHSGAWDKDNKFHMNGDLISTDPYFPFAVEIKGRKSFDLYHFFKPIKDSDIMRWYMKIKKYAEDKIPMVALKCNHRPWLFFIGLKDFYTYCSLKDKLDNYNHLIWGKDDERIIVFDESSKDFLIDIYNNYKNKHS